MNFDQFIAKYNGRGVDFDGVYGYQCMDLMNAYVREVLGITNHPLGAPTAYQSYLNGAAGFTKIANTPTGVPQKGDIIYWNTSVGSAGHVAIFIDGNTSTFRSFDQNWPLNSLSHIQTHNYNGVAGWLRPNSIPQTNQGGNMASLTTPDDVNNLYLQFLGRPAAGDPGSANWVGKPWPDAYFGIKDSVEGQNHTKMLLAAVENAKNLAAQVDSLTNDNTALKAQADQNTKQIADLTKQVTDLHAQLANQSGDTSALTIGDLVGLIWKKIRNVNIK